MWVTPTELRGCKDSVSNKHRGGGNTVRQAERILQREITTRLRFAPLDAILVPSPNGVYIPGRTPAERELARRIIHQLKVDGQILVGAPDLVFLWEGGCGCIELKRPPGKTLLGKQRAGTLSAEQRKFLEQCFYHNVPYVVCQSWPEVRDQLKHWGRLPPDWLDAEQRVGRRAA